ncbi:MAG: hypothetical protein AAB250_19950 [Bdellovibrionota bacterium]
MSAEESFLTLKNFFETRAAAKQALSVIDESAEIGIVIGDTVECALIQREGHPIVERRAAAKPDIIFKIKPESVVVLNDRTKDEIGDIGVNIMKEILAGNISVRIPGNLFNLLRRGYVEMIKEGGAPVAAFLARHGMGQVAKIVSTIKQMKG